MIKPVNGDRLYDLIEEEYLDLLPTTLRGKTFDDQYTAKCETLIKKKTGRKHAFMCHSGTAGLTLAMLAGDIGPGDEVICPNYGYVASVNQIGVVGAVPRYIDVDLHGHINVDLIEKHINKKTKGIVVVGLYGDNPDLEKITAIAKKHKLYLINDAAQSYFSYYNGKMCDTFGDVAVYSFGRNKVCCTFVTCGCIVTDSDTLAYKIKRMRTNGKTGRDSDIEYLGINSQPHEDKCLQVWLSLQQVDKWIERRHVIGKIYDYEFTKAEVNFRRVPRKNLSVRQKYAVFFKDRDTAYKKMMRNGVECQKHYRDNFGTGVLAKNKIKNHHNTTFYNNSSLSIPMHSFLYDSEVEKVVSIVKKFKNV